MSGIPIIPFSGGQEKDKDSQWYFTAEQLASSPSRRQGIDSDQELSYRQMTAYLIQEMGQRLQVSQLCINTAIVYMHRFYAFHSFTNFHRNGIAAASLFLAAKVEEQPRKLEHVIKAANKCLNQPTSSITDSSYIEQAQDLVFNENVLLQTLGFDVAIDHPHTHVVKTCHLVKACKDLAQTSYFLASNSLHLTSMCLQYKPTVVACFCIYLACKWSRWEIPQSTEGKHWFHYVDKTVTMDLLKQLTDEFIAIYEKSPARLKSKLNLIKSLAQGASNRVVNKDKKAPQEEWKMGDMMKMYHSSINTNDVSNTSFSSQTSLQNDQQSQNSIQPSLLPPPPQQQLRKSELHSSQHRTHHSSSSHHHPKNAFASGDVPDHKSSHKQQTFAGLTNRPRVHNPSPQSHQPMIAPSAGQSRISSTSSRSSITSSIPGQPIPRQSSTQGQPLDVNYHKSRERTNLPGPTPHVVPTHAGHKLSQKQDSVRVLSKDPTGRISEQGKQSSSKMFSSGSMSVSQYINNQIASGSQLTVKMEPNLDMPRNMPHSQQRGYALNNGPSSGGAPLVYPQPRQTSSSSSSSKHDQPKPISVHMQQQQLHKQTIPHESTYVAGAHSHDAQQHSHTPAIYSNVRTSETLHTDDHAANTHFTSAHTTLPQSQTQSLAKTASSMFSPDWNDKIMQPLKQEPPTQKLEQPNMGGSYNGSASSDSFGFKMSTGTKDSPKIKTERDRTLETHIKKEKNRSSHLATDPAAIIGARASIKVPPQPLKPASQIKLETPVNTNELAGTSAGVKRPMEISTYIKQEDDMTRDSKIRRLDNTLSMAGKYSDSRSVGDLSKLQVVNGIETNPDLVRSLLKESLCTTNALIKTEPIPAPSLYPPMELLQPTSVATTQAYKNSNEAAGIGGGNAEKLSLEGNEQVGGKAEKKKKKDKHKHKEKDKTKDREERKKHKKDKDRHKERERDSSNSAEPFKIKISKEKVEPTDTGGLKIKIPIKLAKEQAAAAPPPQLKIKILKGKTTENYCSGGASDSNVVPQMQMAGQSTANMYPTMSVHNTFADAMPNNGSGSSSSSTKKRERERERDKDKKRTAYDTLKSNGSTSTATSASATTPMPMHMPGTLLKNQNSSKSKE